MESESHAPHESGEMGLFDHLRELRYRLLISFGVIIVASFGAFPFSGEIFGFLALPFQETFPPSSLIGTGPAEAFLLRMKLSIFAGILGSLPILFYQVWAFIVPGLYDEERKYVIPFVVVSSINFLVGAWFAHFVVLGYAFEFFASQYQAMGVTPAIRMSEQLSFVAQTIIAFGLTFEFPVLAFFLAKIGLITHRTLIDGARYAVVIIFVIAAIVSPPDVLTQFLLAGPLLILYALSILVVRWAQRGDENSLPASTEEGGIQ